jgi:hypothetical protein
MRAVDPPYYNNEEMIHKDKIKYKNHKNDIFRMMMIVTMKVKVFVDDNDDAA